MRRMRMLAIATAVVMTLGSCGGSKPSAPEPGSMADRMCDTNETDAGYVTMGGKSYDAECLDVYSWEAD